MFWINVPDVSLALGFDARSLGPVLWLLQPQPYYKIFFNG